MHYTRIYEKVPEGYIGYIQETPGVNTQGDTLEETRENLEEALTLILQCNEETNENLPIYERHQVKAIKSIRKFIDLACTLRTSMLVTRHDGMLEGPGFGLTAAMP